MIHRVPEKGALVEFSLALDVVKEQFVDLPEDALILLEAYRTSEAWERIYCGTVGSPLFPQKKLLEQFEWEDPILFRVKIVSSGEGPTKILAWNTQVKADDVDVSGNKNRSLLPIVSSKELGDRFWKLAWMDDVPELHVNALYEGSRPPKQIVLSDPGFHAFVYPQIVESVFEGLLITRRDEYDRDEDPCGWLQFAEKVLKVDAPPDPDNDRDNYEDHAKQWIDYAVDKFCSYRDIQHTFETHDLTHFGNND
ncbi:MAG: hypothetical protein P1U89_18825 [Verrucomicrobiales bacterium]|nr:hypothetical protein [Verrucomicrobiales bacterium]